MAEKISRKAKLTLLVLIALVGSGILYVYDKLFGGKAKPLPANQFVVGGGTSVAPTSQQAMQEIVAVAYADTPAQGIDEVVERTGNLDFIKPGQKVLIKPNVNSDDPAPATTHPQAVAELVRLVKAKGAYVIVGDRSNASYNTMAAMKKTGIYDAVNTAGADEIVGFEDEEWVRVAPEKATSWPNGFRIPKRLASVDHIISLPVLHTHYIASHSLAIKNLVGLINPTDRMIFHASGKINEMIAEIGLAIKPSLTVIDGTEAFIAGGPFKGTLAEPKVYLASKDLLAADVVGVAILKKHGATLFTDDAWQSGQIKHFTQLGLSAYTKEDIEKEIGKI